jgi:hypothetical protein
MDCKEFEKHIPDYIARKLDYPTLKRFSEHIDKCEDCKEELVIRFLVAEGIQRLEDGNAFDLQSELDTRLEETRRKIRFHNCFLYFGFALEVVAVGLLAGIVIWVLL